MYKYNLAYNAIAPIGHILKHKYPMKYFRIHYFKDKQYPIKKNDYKSIINLYNTLFHTLISSKTTIGYLSTYDLDINKLENKWINDLTLSYYGKYDIHEEDEDSYYVSVYQFTFEQSSFEKIIIDIADEEFDGSIIFFDKSNRNIIAPYPGGVDIFINNEELINIYKDELKDYLK